MTADGATAISRRSRASSPAPRKSVNGKVDEEAKENSAVNVETFDADDVSKISKVVDYAMSEEKAPRTRGCCRWLGRILVAMLLITAAALIIIHRTLIVKVMSTVEVPDSALLPAAVGSSGLLLVLLGAKWLLARRRGKASEAKDA
mmetsp:Transcript_29631/g.64463  ORF Transcript_29631/g.64463 Transcript_29631/m.64463 type:complete len:146 (+) Transcript_29631:51-488(+)|eukprot:CAMPEP_0170629224 /NCGR_PEP_ID=MMETSP0224-20130122/33213_1 /TAXON_ID=285029 /ORGANISM="Togula jolla, Strain CCCM 725" /LENGTH=145 /DNA_ID=CAMNT_0010956921 /DNA_START=48 /DNA_END=485 /DNA_ORIENTATION=+